MASSRSSEPSRRRPRTQQIPSQKSRITFPKQPIQKSIRMGGVSDLFDSSDDQINHEKMGRTPVNIGNTPLSNAQNARMMKVLDLYSAGNRGLIDGGKTAAVVVPAGGKYTVRRGTLQEKGGLPVFPRARFSPGVDIRGVDDRSPDLLRMKLKSGKIIRGGDDGPADRKTLKNVAKILNQNFSKRELRNMDLYIEPSVMMTGCAASHARIHTAGKDFSVIFVRADLEPDILESTLTHEAVHARRAAHGQLVRDQDREESMTEFETLGRLSRRGARAARQNASTHGYYRHIGATTREHKAAHAHDRALITRKGTAKRNRGSSLTRRTKDLYPQSAISRLKIETSTPKNPRQGTEWIDRYFLIQTPRGGSIDFHMAFTKKAPLSEVRKNLQNRFGKNIKAWEYHDGKKKVILPLPSSKTSASKQNCRKKPRRNSSNAKR